MVSLQARSKLPKKRRRVLPVEQPRRKRGEGVINRRMNAIKHHHPAIFKDAFGSAKIGNDRVKLLSPEVYFDISIFRTLVALTAVKHECANIASD